MSDSPPPDTPTVVFVTDNGHGMGHITRLFAIARRANGRFTPAFITMSEGFPVLAEEGIACEYLPSKDKLGVTQSEWVHVMSPFIAAGIDMVDARAIVVDHVAAPKVVRPMRQALEGRQLVWSRRGMWKPGRNLGNAVEGAETFDSIVEPLDVTSPFDRGASARFRDKVTTVPPITLVRPSEYLDRDDARRELGLDADSLAILMQVTGPDAQRIESMIGAVVDLLEDNGRARPVQLFAPIHVLADRAVEPVRPVRDGVTTVRRRVYPLARHLQAFDGVITTAGYNSFHEVLQSGVPGLFIPRDSDTLDDQPARARVPEMIGAGLHADDMDDPHLAQKISRLLDPVTAAGSRAAAATLFEHDGAQAFADHVLDLLMHASREPAPVKLRPGRPPLRKFMPDVRLVKALNASPEELAELATSLDASLPDHRRTATFVLTCGTDGGVLRSIGVSQVRLMGPDEWQSIGSTVTHEAYLTTRAATLEACLVPAATISTNSDGWIRDVDSWKSE